MLVIFGALGGLGSGLVQLLNDQSRLLEPYGTLVPAGRDEVDIESEASVDAFFERLATQTSPNERIYLIDACGVSINGIIAKYSLADWHKTVSANLTSSFLIARASAKLFKNHPGSSLLFFSSVTSSFGVPGTAAYASTKGALKSFVQTCAQEFGRSRSRVNALELGYFDRGMIKQVNPELQQMMISKTALQRLGTSSDLFAACDFALRCEYYTGSTLVLDGGLS